MISILQPCEKVNLQAVLALIWNKKLSTQAMQRTMAKWSVLKHGITIGRDDETDDDFNHHDDPGDLFSLANHRGS